MSVFSSIKQLISLARNVDLKQLQALSKKVDLGEAMKSLGQLDENQLKGLLKMMGQGKKHRPDPEIDGDFYDVAHTLTAEERALQLEVRHFMEAEIQPVVNEYWYKDEFPFEIIPKMAALNICGGTYQGYGCRGISNVMEGVLAMEMARIDTSISTFFGVQSGLSMGSVYLLGSEEQKQEWLPAMREMTKIGAFGLTEPEGGSDVSAGMRTTAEWKGGRWVLNGQKKWIGNAPFADMIIIWAKDLNDGQVKGFIVRKDAPGLHVEKIKNKMALRIVQNGLITLTNCEVEEKDRLQLAASFKDTAKVLKMTRAGVAWQAVGCARGAYENALRYTLERKQFGKPISSFQLIQNHLVEMLSNLTAMQTMMMRLSELQQRGQMTDEQASLAKVFCSLRTRDIVSKAREVMGGNGILLDHNVARFVADAEAIYSYEGTKEINTLIVGRAITGHSAFV